MKALVAIFIFYSFLLGKNDLIPKWTQYGRLGSSHLEELGGLSFFRLKRIKQNSYRDIRFIGLFIPKNTIVTMRYKSSNKYNATPHFYRFNVTSLKKNSISGLKVRYHYNQGFGAFLLERPFTHITSEIALSFDMSDYLNSTRKTSYFKGGLFWDLNVNRTFFAFDLEYFYQISDLLPGDPTLSRYEISAEANIWIKDPWLLTIGFEQEFYFAEERVNSKSLYLAFGFKRPANWNF
ncbi:MAG: hypothetical protein CMG75_04380 [Candidatus Marinimicrobia bacterium]|nr:hypothetical protein [Candidatus Neomarinimicrobiota bacterium]|tara:strand:- start:53034 stop:53741 length:708 start_codon:yes stop_codon:yes gene_type:complete